MLANGGSVHAAPTAASVLVHSTCSAMPAVVELYQQCRRAEKRLNRQPCLAARMAAAQQAMPPAAAGPAADAAGQRGSLALRVVELEGAAAEGQPSYVCSACLYLQQQPVASPRSPELLASMPPTAALLCRRSLPLKRSTHPPSSLPVRAGFKSYAEQVVVGDPFGPFTCVVGPNGCGKSVVVSGGGAAAACPRLCHAALLTASSPLLEAATESKVLSAPLVPQGEAIAFALGGNARMMRARNLGALVTNLGSCSGGSSSGGGGSSGGGSVSAAPTAAEVTLHFDLIESLIAGDFGGSGSPAEGGGDAAHAAAATAAAAPSQPNTQQCLAGRLLVRRRVTRSGRSELAIQRLPAPSRTNEAAAAGGSGSGGGGKAQWQAVTPTALHDLLAPFGIQTEAVDR